MSFENNLFEKESVVSSYPYLEIKSFNPTKSIYQYLSNLKPNSPRTKEACLQLGIEPIALINQIKQSSPRLNFKKNASNLVKDVVNEMQTFSNLKLLKEIFKKRKELSPLFSKKNEPKSFLENPPLKNYFRKRFYSPEAKRDDFIDEICNIENSFEKVRDKDSSFSKHLQRNIENSFSIERKQIDYKEKLEEVEEKLKKCQIKKELVLSQKIEKNMKLRNHKIEALQKIKNDLKQKFQKLKKEIEEKQIKFKKRRQLEFLKAGEQKREYLEKEYLKRERAQLFQLEENERIEEKGKSILEGLAQKTEMSFLKRTRNFFHSEEKNKEKTEKVLKNEKEREMLDFQNKIKKIVLKNERDIGESLKQIIYKKKSPDEKGKMKEKLKELEKEEEERIKKILKEREEKEIKRKEILKEKKMSFLIKTEKEKWHRGEKYQNYKRIKTAYVN